MSASQPIVINSDASSTAEKAANEADIAKNEKPDDGQSTANDAAKGINPVKKIADEIVGKMGDIQDHKDNLMAVGIPFNTVNVLVEMSIHNRGDELDNMRTMAVETSRKQHGAGGISEEKLANTLESLVALEKDLGLVRRLGQQQGLNMTALNHLTMLVRLNPGDGGVKVVNTLLAYALACEIPLDKVNELSEEITAGPASVLPDIARDDEVDKTQAARKQLITDVCVGCVMAVIALALLT